MSFRKIYPLRSVQDLITKREEDFILNHFIKIPDKIRLSIIQSRIHPSDKAYMELGSLIETEMLRVLTKHQISITLKSHFKLGQGHSSGLLRAETMLDKPKERV